MFEFCTHDQIVRDSVIWQAEENGTYLPIDFDENETCEQTECVECGATLVLHDDLTVSVLDEPADLEAMC